MERPKEAWYSNADVRKKLADALVDGLPLRIEGGDYRLCNGGSAFHGCGNCYKQKINTKSDAVSIPHRFYCVMLSRKGLTEWAIL